MYEDTSIQGKHLLEVHSDKNLVSEDSPILCSQGVVVAKTEFIHTPTIEINLNSQIHLVSTSELIENDSLNKKITQAINKSVKITEYQTMNCLPFCVKTYIM